jgi:hypothetical protein
MPSPDFPLPVTPSSEESLPAPEATKLCRLRTPPPISKKSVPDAESGTGEGR